jgi:Tfp pilus assembly protein PilO
MTRKVVEVLTNRTSRWSLGAAFLCIVLLAASWFLLISPRRADAAAVRAQVVQSDAQAVTLQAEIAELKSQFADLPKQEAQLKAIKVQLPPNAGIPSLVRDLRTFAEKTGVALDSLTPGSPTVLGATGTAPAAAGSVVNIPLQISVTGDYFEAALFVKNIQTKLPRSILITALSIAPAQALASEVTPTAAATPSAGATPSAAPVPAATVAPITLDRVSMTLTSSVFVLMDETTTLEDVQRQIRAAGGKVTIPPTSTPAATGTPTPTN